MDAEIINPFVESTLNVLSTMAQLNFSAQKLALKKNNKTWGVVTGIIGLAGYQANGNMLISFEEKTILAIVSKMLMEEFKELNDQVIDAVGEVTNMVCGGAKAKLSEKGFFFELARPVMLVGEQIEIKQLGNRPIITVPFKSEVGGFVLEASLETVKTS